LHKTSALPVIKLNYIYSPMSRKNPVNFADLQVVPSHLPGQSSLAYRVKNPESQYPQILGEMRK
jgi:hypothetical protein